MKTPCNSGYYQSGTAQSSCTACAPGSISPTSGAQTGCTACTPGYYQNESGKTTCKACTSGYCSQSGCTGCTSCSNLSTPAVHEPNPSAPFVRGDSCTACTATGTCTAVSCRTGTVMTSYADCQWCSSMFGNCATCTTSRCLTCPAGETVTSASSCTGNKYYHRTGELCGYCEECPSGKEPSSDRLSCVNSSCASKGYVAACQPGQGATYAGVTGSDGKCYTCSTCVAGTYSMGGTNSCQSCNSGYYAPAGSPKCYGCSAPSSTCRQLHGPCEEDPIGCAACNSATGECSAAICPSTSVAYGVDCWYCNYVMQGCSTCSSRTSCSACKSGYVKSNGCPAGKVWQSAGNANHLTDIDSPCGTCVDAGPTQTCAQINSNYKTSCPAGYGATSTGKTGTDGACYTCALCDESHYSAGGTGACSSCPSGTMTCGTGASSSSQCLSTSTYQTYTGCPSGYTNVSNSKCGTLAGSRTHDVCTQNAGYCSSDSNCSATQYCSSNSCVERTCLNACYSVSNHQCVKSSDDCCTTDRECQLEFSLNSKCLKLVNATTGKCTEGLTITCTYTDATTCKNNTANCQYCKKNNSTGCYTCSSYYEVSSSGNISGGGCTGTMTEYTLYGHTFCCPSGVVPRQTANWHNKCMQSADEVDARIDSCRCSSSGSCSYVTVGDHCVWSGNGIACADKWCE